MTSAQKYRLRCIGEVAVWYLFVVGTILPACVIFAIAAHSDNAWVQVLGIAAALLYAVLFAYLPKTLFWLLDKYEDSIPSTTLLPAWWVNRLARGRRRWALAALQNPKVGAQYLEAAASSEDWPKRWAALTNPKIDIRLLEAAVYGEDWQKREAALANPACPDHLRVAAVLMSSSSAPILLGD